LNGLIDKQDDTALNEMPDCSKDDKCFLVNPVYPYNPFNLVQNFLNGEGIKYRV